MRLLFDVDGVCCDLSTAVVNLVNDIHGTSFMRIDLKCWGYQEALGLSDADWQPVEASVSAPGFAEHLPPIHAAVSAIRRLSAQHDVAFVTCPWKTSPTWAWDRKRWLDRVFSGMAFDYVPTKSKALVSGHVFVDDKPSNVHEWLAENGRHKSGNVWGAFVLSQPWNRSNVLLPRIDALVELEEIVRRCAA